MDERILAATREGYVTPDPSRPAYLWPILVPRRISGHVLDVLLACMTAQDEMYLRSHPSTPLLYQTGIRYEREPVGQEQWLTVPFCLLRQEQGGGCDCEDLACWRAAELRVRGEDARAFWTSRQRDGRNVYHIRVRRASGRIEDPSAALGMGREWASFWGPRHSIIDGDRS